MPGTVSGIWNMAANIIGKNLCALEAYILVMKTDNK